MKYAWIGVMVAACGTLANAQDVNVSGVQILSHGIYAVGEPSKTVVDNSGVGHRSLGGRPHLIATTTRVPAKLGVHFGFEFKMNGTPSGESISYRQEVHYPLPGANVPGGTAPLAMSSATYPATLNRTSYTGYALTDPWELIPGKWLIQVWVGDKKLAEQAFYVTRK
ncbi:MAG TPA: DUF3859 domain-containing protein [Nitrospira sp.]